jgi:hypothetical protein
MGITRNGPANILAPPINPPPTSKKGIMASAERKWFKCTSGHVFSKYTGQKYVTCPRCNHRAVEDKSRR